MVDGKSDLGRGLACCDASFQGIDYCPENDNPLLRCPYERKDCPHSISGFPVPLCPCHTTGKRYSYEQSAERVESERSERQHRQYMEITGGAYCACVVGGNGYDGGHVEVQYDVEQCIRCRCQNPVCVIRKQKRDLSRANIFYDVRRTWITRIGFLEEKKVQVTKGERVFRSSDLPNGRGDLAGNEKGALQPALEQFCDRLPAPDTRGSATDIFQQNAPPVRGV